MNELDIHIKTLKKELKEIEEQLLTVVVLYKETFTKIIQTSKIEELKLKRQQEIDFLVNEEFEKNNIAEKYNVLNLKK